MSAAGNWRSDVVRPMGMLLRPALFVVVVCLGCGEATNNSSAGTTRSSGLDVVLANAPTTSPIAAGSSASTADDRSGYVPVGPSRSPQVPEEALAQTVPGLSDAMRTATLGPPPANSPGAPDGIWVHIDAAGDGSDPTLRMEAEWESAMLVGAMADRTTSNAELASVIKGLAIDYTAADGTVSSESQPTNNNIVAGQQFLAPGDDTEIERTATATLVEFGLQPDSVTVLHPLDSALKVVATIPTPEAMNGRLAELQSALTGTPPSYEGVYLEIRLPDGSPIAVLSTAFRGGRGSQWERPDLEDILGGPANG